MSTYRMPALTTAEIRSIADKAVADVTRQKITTSTVEQTGVAKKQARSGRYVQHGVNSKSSSSQISKNPKSDAIQKSLAASVLSQSAGRGYFKEAFNKARKG